MHKNVCKKAVILGSYENYTFPKNWWSKVQAGAHRKKALKYSSRFMKEKCGFYFYWMRNSMQTSSTGVRGRSCPVAFVSVVVMHVAVIVVLFVNVLHNLQHLQFVWPLVSEFRRMKHRQTKTTVTNQCFCQILATGIVARRLNKKVCNWKLLGCCIRKMSLFRV